MPVQRIPRYNMLLKDLVKHTWEDHPDANNLNVALQKITEVAEYLNEKKRQAEMLKILVLIQSAISGKKVPYIVNGDRVFIRQGNVTNEKGTAFVVYLFNDMMIIGKPDTTMKIIQAAVGTKKSGDLNIEPMKFKESLQLSEVSIRGVDGTSFEVLKSQKVVYTFSCKEKESWVKDLQQALDKIHVGSKQPTKEQQDVSDDQKNNTNPLFLEEQGLGTAEEVVRNRRKTQMGFGTNRFKGVKKNYNTVRDRSNTVDGMEEVTKREKEKRDQVAGLEERKAKLEAELKNVEIFAEKVKPVFSPRKYQNPPFLNQTQLHRMPLQLQTI